MYIVMTPNNSRLALNNRLYSFISVNKVKIFRKKGWAKRAAEKVLQNYNVDSALVIEWPKDVELNAAGKMTRKEVKDGMVKYLPHTPTIVDEARK